MIKALVFDLSRTLIFPKDRAYTGELNALYRKLVQDSNFDFITNFELNEELFLYLTNLKEKYKMYLFTSGTLQNAPEIKNKIDALFDKVFSAEHMMIKKNEYGSYKKISQLLGLMPNNILFVDDSLDNINAAKFAGLNAFQYKDNKSVINYIEAII